MDNFPVDQISKDQSVLCLFCAAFGGANDVQHLYNAGFGKVTMVDNDLARLLEMRDKFGYKAICKDAFSVIDELIKNRIHYDVIISDQWTHHDALINEAYYEKLESIAQKVLILGISQNYLNQVKKPKGNYYKRSNHNGGVYWRIVKKR